MQRDVVGSSTAPQQPAEQRSVHPYVIAVVTAIIVAG